MDNLNRVAEKKFDYESEVDDDLEMTIRRVRVPVTDEEKSEKAQQGRQRAEERQALHDAGIVLPVSPLAQPSGSHLTTGAATGAAIGAAAGGAVICAGIDAVVAAAAAVTGAAAGAAIGAAVGAVVGGAAGNAAAGGADGREERRRIRAERRRNNRALRQQNDEAVQDLLNYTESLQERVDRAIQEKEEMAERRRR
eukprot:scpid92530/ scgid26447/ 